MRKTIAILAFVFTLSIVLSVQWYSVNAGTDHGQQIIDNYLDRSNHSAEKVKFHLALMRTTTRMERSAA
jgi:3D (Asp-Asp-Asp) domain-containing protein